MTQICYSLVYFFLVSYCTANQPRTGILIREELIRRSRPMISSDFSAYTKVLADDNLVVDKSLLIKEFLEDKGKVYLITCPRGWGKSLNMDMIKTFLQIPLEYSEVYQLNISFSYDIFVHGEINCWGKEPKKLQTPLLITEHATLLDKYQGKYPVIHLCLYGTHAAKNFDNLMNNFFTDIQNAYHRFFFITKTLSEIVQDKCQNESVRVATQKRLNMYQHYTKSDKIDSRDIEHSIQFLSRILYDFFQQKVYVFIDEYHQTWESLFIQDAFTEEDVQKFLNFYTNFMVNTFKNNPYLEKGILTGELPASHELYLSAFHDATECNLLNGKFMEYYGFNQWEMNQIYAHMNISSDIQEELKRWYNGYKVNHKNLQLYNPFAISFYMWNKKIKSYWTDRLDVSEYVKNGLRIESFAEKLRASINGTDIVVMQQQRFTWQEYRILIKAMKCRVYLDDDFTEKALQHLYHLGYFTLSRDFDIESQWNNFTLKIPNAPIISQFEELIR